MSIEASTSPRHKIKLQHWRGFPDTNGLKGAPALEFATRVSENGIPVPS